VLFWLAELVTWLAAIWLLSLFGQDQFVVAGDSETIGYAFMKDDYFM